MNAAVRYVMEVISSHGNLVPLALGSGLVLAAMAVSFVFAGGFSRSVAVWLRDSWQVPEQWLGFTTGLVFALPLMVFMYLLERVPAPDAEDIKERSLRLPMTKHDRKNFLQLFGGGIVVVLDDRVL